MELVIDNPGEQAEFRSQGIEDTWAPLKRLRRRAMSAMYRFPDTGLFGLHPLRKHVLICGFPRSGTTMLQLMLENTMPHARRFGCEVGGWRAATYSWRNHRVVVSKVPQDVFRLAGLRDFYNRRQAELKIILMVRDPRDVLTSQRETNGPQGYVVSPERWRRYHRAVMAERSSADCLTVRYEDLIADPLGEQARIAQFVQEEFEVPFDQFHKPSRPDFQTDRLNGLRPLERSRIARWAKPCHQQQFELCRAELPELDEALRGYGYDEVDARSNVD